MKFLIEISTQSCNVPTRLPGVDNPGTDCLLANGWRWADTSTIPEVVDGYTRSPIHWADAGDGVNAVAQYTDRLQSEIDAEAKAADLAASGTRYALQNQYMTLCGQLTGQAPCKLGFAELQAIITTMQSTNPEMAMGLALQLLTLDAALKREGGLQWWDQCVWTEGLPS